MLLQSNPTVDIKIEMEEGVVNCTVVIDRGNFVVIGGINGGVVGTGGVIRRVLVDGGIVVAPHPGTLKGQSQTPNAGLKTVPEVHGIV